MRTENKKFDAIKYYLITLSSIVARQLEKASRSPNKELDFNLACFMLIDANLNENNTGATLVEYIIIHKVEGSQYYLRISGEKISDITDRFCFCNQSYFTRICKKYSGQTPRRFWSGLVGDYFQYTIPRQEK
jgi:methylphosphotriester-DNA--protein-cysteine methyltransferase